jgi:hypothetical protein
MNDIVVGPLREWFVVGVDFYTVEEFSHGAPALLPAAL